MKDLNRKPDSMADTLVLIEDLRAEVLRRPRFVAVRKYPVTREAEHAGGNITVLDLGKDFEIDVEKGGQRFLFQSSYLKVVEDHIEREPQEGPGNIVSTERPVWATS